MMIYYPTGPSFVTDRHRVASSSERIEVYENDMIQIDFAFEYKGPAQTVTIEAGNCNKLSEVPFSDDRWYDKGSRNTLQKSLPASPSSYTTITGSVSVQLEATYGIFTYRHIYFLIEGKDMEFVVEEALIPHSEAEFRNLAILDWAKV